MGWGAGRGGYSAPQRLEFGAAQWGWPQQQWLQIGGGQMPMEPRPPTTPPPPRTAPQDGGRRPQGQGGKGELQECRDFARGVCTRGVSCKFSHRTV
jgi:hypothetical protein